MIADSVPSSAQPLAVPTDWKPLDLLRLGWMIAEVRGRYRLGDNERLQADQHIDRHQHALPLAPERSVAEQRIEAEEVLASLATRLSLDRSALDLGVDRKKLDNDAETAITAMKSLAVLLAGQRKQNPDSVAGT